MKLDIGIGVIGAGYMGKAYAIALSQVSSVYQSRWRARKAMIATTNPDGAARYAAQFDFDRSTGDWRALVSDPKVDVVAIAAPTHFHAEMARAALEQGKHVICEKPLARNLAEAVDMARAAQTAGTVTMVGFNYMQNPASQLAREIIKSGEIGEVIHFSGSHFEDYLMDPALAHDWRLTRACAGRAGALGDLASHIINMAHFLCGPIDTVIGQRQTIHARRPDADGAMKAVETDDQCQFLLNFASGAPGTIQASRVHAGRKMGLTYEVVGTRGALRFDQERMAELQLYDAGDRAGRQGYRTILASPGHGDYGQFCIGAGHGFGFNDMITVEFARLLEAVADGTPVWPGFAEGVHIAAVVDAVLASCDTGARVSVIDLEKEAWA